ncbi:MAG: GTP 3',8-cyclase MoaA [Mycobacterium sp.]|nr:GTP 3',8-cyclase MoaA [Mycobacterium sp.]
MSLVDLELPRVRQSAGRSETSVLVDRFGRIARDLRVSLTQQCSLRCRYCMPAAGLPVLPAETMLTAEETVRLVVLAVRELGIRTVRFTGGEPLMRRDLEKIVAQCHQEIPDIPLTLTTNGLGLQHRAQNLAAAGLHRVNISLDTIDRASFAALTRRDRLPAVQAGISAAQQAGLTPVKINAVLVRETLCQAPDLLHWCLDNGLYLRFLENMPLDADQHWARSSLVTAEELLAVLSAHHRLTPLGRLEPADPAELWLVDEGPHTVGVIASVTRNFCAACDRTRLTADGKLRSCLFSDDEIDVLGPLRAGASDRHLVDLWRASAWRKSAGHRITSPDFQPPHRSMGQIGG